MYGNPGVAGQVILSLEQSNNFVLYINTMLVDTDAQALAAEVRSASCTYPPSAKPRTTVFSVNYNDLSSVDIPPLGKYEITCSLQTASFGDIDVGSYALNGEPRVGGERLSVCLAIPS